MIRFITYVTLSSPFIALDMKRCIDILLSSLGLFIFSPILFIAAILIWSHDFSSPFYIAPRIGLNGVPFNMVKLRSMTVYADRSGVDSTSDSDVRITPVGRIIRKYKIDELVQLFNVLVGQMSLVGPRPNVERETNMYTSTELGLLTVKPGITDFSSIIFSDEGRILNNHADPDLAYHQLIRPYKSALGLLYVRHRSVSLDLQIIFITALSLLSRELSLRLNTRVLSNLRAPTTLLQISTRTSPLIPSPPPGASIIVTSRSGSVS